MIVTLFSTYNLFVQPVCVSFYPPIFYCFFPCFFPPLLSYGLATAVTKDNQGVKKKLWDRRECYYGSLQAAGPGSFQQLSLKVVRTVHVGVKFADSSVTLSWGSNLVSYSDVEQCQDTNTGIGYITYLCF